MGERKVEKHVSNAICPNVDHSPDVLQLSFHPSFHIFETYAELMVFHVFVFSFSGAVNGREMGERERGRRSTKIKMLT